MLHNEARELLVNGFLRIHDAKTIAAIFDVSVPTVYRLVEQKKKTGSVALRVHLRGRKPVLSEEDIARIGRAIQTQPDITIHELVEQLQLQAGDETVRRAVVKLGYRYKKKMIHASEQERPDVQEKRKRWRADVSQIDPKKLVFVDESGVNTDMARKYGRAQGKERVVDHVPLNKPKKTTILSALRVDGTTAFHEYSGSMTGERFKDYLENVLVPTLKPGDYVVMDNLPVHHVKGVQELIESADAIALYLPPYSPDLTPIEQMWSKIKSVLRKWRVRCSDALEAAVHNAFALVCPKDCRGWFSAAGYQ